MLLEHKEVTYLVIIGSSPLFFKENYMSWMNCCFGCDFLPIYVKFYWKLCPNYENEGCSLTTSQWVDKTLWRKGNLYLCRKYLRIRGTGEKGCKKQSQWTHNIKHETEVLSRRMHGKAQICSYCCKLIKLGSWRRKYKFSMLDYMAQIKVLPWPVACCLFCYGGLREFPRELFPSL